MKFRKTKLVVLVSAMVLSMVAPTAALDNNKCPSSTVGHRPYSYSYSEPINYTHSYQTGTCYVTGTASHNVIKCEYCGGTLNDNVTRNENHSIKH